MKESYEKISPTAKLIAHLRTFTDIPFAKEIATKSGAEKTFKELADDNAKSMIRLAPLLEARYKATNRILVERGITQVLEIAAGLSPRGLAMAQNPDVVYVATDLPTILQEVKEITQTILAKSNGERPTLHFQPANCFNIDSLLIAAVSFKHEKPIAVITEGLFPYFTRDERKILAENIYQLLKKYPGIWVATDVHIKQSLQKVDQHDDTANKRLNRVSKSSGSDIQGNVFDGEDDLKNFFYKSGFKVEQISFLNVFDDLSAIKILNLTQEEILIIRHQLENLKTLILTPLNT